MKKILFILIFAAIGFATKAQTADTTLHASLISKAPDVTSISYQWTKVSGPSAGTISTPNQATTDVKGLVVGVYVFQCIAKDNFGVQSAPSQVKVTVVRNAQPPVINAGPDITITAK